MILVGPHGVKRPLGRLPPARNGEIDLKWPATASSDTSCAASGWNNPKDESVVKRMIKLFSSQRRGNSGSLPGMIVVPVLCILFLQPGATRLWSQERSAAAPAPQMPAKAQSLPSAKIGPILAEFNRGAAYLEMYEYAKAALAFNQVLDEAPDWSAARFNRGLAYFNMASEDDAKKRLGDSNEMIAIAAASFEEILKTEPEHLPALFCLGVLRAHGGDDEQALQCFEKVYRKDPSDLFAAYSYAKALKNANRANEAVSVLEKIFEHDPGFVSALKELGQLYMRQRKAPQAKAILERFKQLQQEELAGGSFMADVKYGTAGKYSFVLGADGLPLPRSAASKPQRVLFSPDPQPVADPAQSWDWQHGRIGLPGVAVADVDGDQDLDLLLTGQGAGGAAQLWLNDGKGKFTAGATLADGAVCPCFGDVDNDGDVDLWLGRAGANQLLLNDGHGQFTPSTTAGIEGADTLTQLATMADLDSDGDLDLMAFRCAAGDVPATADHAQSAPSSVFLNNTDGTFIDRAADVGLQLPDATVASVVYDDFDNDFDLDLVVFSANAAPAAWVNFRAGHYRLVAAQDCGLTLSAAISATSGDPDKDGDRDLLVFTPDGVRLFLNNGHFVFAESASFSAGLGRLRGTGGQFADIDNDGDLDIVIADARRADGSRGPALLLNTWPEFGFVDATQADAGNLFGALRTEGDASCVVADFTGDGRCDVLLAPVNQPPLLIENATRGGHWIALDLAGTRPQEPKARSNQSAIGARVEVRYGSQFQQYVVGGGAGPVASQALRVHAGLGDQAKVEWLRVFWPDSVLQAEIEVAGDRLMSLEELPRKPSSCPYLFVWDGQRFTFVSDFGGVGGLGYYAGNRRYAQPDPTEYLPLPTIQPRDGYYVLQSMTPLEEITYFDEAKLIAVDHPQGTRVYPNEMAAISVAPPEFELFCVRHPLFPERAVDHRGHDVTDALRAVDRCYAGATHPDRRFIGLAEDHFIEADFGGQLAGVDPAARIVLFLHGWVEYGYSSTNYAATQAGMSLRAPTIEVWRDGAWVALAHEVGYPAGVNHMMTVDLTGKIRSTDQRLRVSSNMEIYWDQMFLAPHDAGAPLRVQEVAARDADLHFRGYPREYSPDGRQPNLCDYDHLDRNVAWKLMSGDFTRLGDVRPLLDKADDCFVIMNHGEEITMRFAASDFSPVPDGYVRSFILKTDSYCKDMDLYTAFPDTVAPLPFHAMSGYPYDSHEHYPDTDTTRAYRRNYNTRRVGNIEAERGH
jgi:tetratricopeptide (TPR) repeat protein